MGESARGERALCRGIGVGAVHIEVRPSAQGGGLPTPTCERIIHRAHRVRERRLGGFIGVRRPYRVSVLSLSAVLYAWCVCARGCALSAAALWLSGVDAS